MANNRSAAIGYTRYDLGTVEPDDIDSDLNGFPVLIPMPDAVKDSDLSECRSDGGDIAIFEIDSNGDWTRVAIEIEQFEQASNPDNAVCVVWALLDLSSANGAEYAVCWGIDSRVQPDSDAQYGSEEVWEANHLAVFHLNESSGTDAYQSVQGGTSGTYQGGMPNQVAGVAGYAQDFPNTSADYVILDNESLFDFTTAFTVEAWASADSLPGVWPPLVAKGDSAWRLHNANGTNYIRFDVTGVSPSSNTGSNNITVGGIHYHAANYTGSATNTYFDGALDNFNSVSGTPSTSNDNVGIGHNVTHTSRLWDGIIEEVRISNTARSADWIKFVYENMENNADTVTVGNDPKDLKLPIQISDQDTFEHSMSTTQTLIQPSTPFTASDLNKTLATWGFEYDGARPDNFLVRCKFQNASTFTFFRQSASEVLGLDVKGKMVAFTENSGIHVQHKEKSFNTGSSTTITLDKAVNPKKAFVYGTYSRNTGSSGIMGSDDSLKFKFNSDGTEVTITSAAPNAGCYAYIQVIEIQSLNVQTIEKSITATTDNNTIDAVDRDRTFLVSSCELAATANGEDVYRAHITSTTNVQYTKYSGSVQSNVYTFVCEFEPGENIKVQEIDYSFTSASSNRSIPDAVDPDKSVVLPSYTKFPFFPSDQADDDASYGLLKHRVTASTTLNLIRGGSTTEVTGTHYVLSFYGIGSRGHGVGVGARRGVARGIG